MYVYLDSNGFGNTVQRTDKATGEQQVYDYWTDGKIRKLTKYEQVPNFTKTIEMDSCVLKISPSHMG